ncbi:hypothetical protein J2810_000302 [Chryseobacterium rhizosphaerae]|uniref:hypothetical protein n=1 Tax=Chryseobacterium rhizosphaerae TaxID=395937 RepID=UPI0028637393|nr:hypothetical protein [Chryseobacterium rhizosphaerae]MDR6544280.1 hypothetical protein [Chryseobacterium rhizosphaerae]
MNYNIILTLIFCLFLFFNCTEKSDKNFRDFNDYSFNTTIEGEGTYGIGYEFEIKKQWYANKKYNFFYYTNSLAERKFLIPGSLANDEFPISWREVNLPFKIVKRADSDTLVVIKNNKEFIFKRVKNSD